MKEQKETPDQRYYRLNREKRKKYLRDYHARLKKAIYDILGHECSRCHYSDSRALQIDHVYGNGVLHRASGFYYHKILKEILAGSAGYQILCANCNWIKRIENNESNH